MNTENKTNILELIENLPCQYQNIYNHPEFDSKTEGIDTIKNGELIADIINQYKKITGKTKVKVLDIGCAQGYYSLKAAELGCDVIAIDLEEKNIQICQYLNSENGFNIDFRKEFFDLNFVENIDSEGFDFVFLFNVIHHVACGVSYGYNTNGLKYAQNVMKALSQKTKILIGSLATSGENIAWNMYLPSNYRDWLKDYSFFDEIRYQYINNVNQKIYRPVIFASNNFSIKNNELIAEVDKSLMSDFLYFDTPGKSMILKKELLTKYPDLVTGHLKNFNFAANFDIEAKSTLDYPFEKYNLLPNSYIYKNNKKYLKKHILGIIYSFKAGRIVRAIYKEENSKIYIIKKIIGTKDNCKGCSYRLTLKDKKREYIKEATLAIDFFNSIKNDEKKLLDEFEIFISEIFRQFDYKPGLLKPESYDICPINALRLPDKKYHFFDFEFEIPAGIEKEFILYKNICYLIMYTDMQAKLDQYYDYFSEKFCLQKKLAWCKYYNNVFGSFECNMYSEKSWKIYNNSLYLKCSKFLCKMAANIIFPPPFKKQRRQYRSKFIRAICYPNYRIAKKNGLQEVFPRTEKIYE